MAGYGQLGRKLSTSIGSFFSPDARQAGEMAGLQQIALEQQIDQNQMRAAAAKQEADRKAEEAKYKTPEASRNRVMQAFNIPLDFAPEIDNQMRTGRIDRFDIGDHQGPVMPTPDWATKQNLGKFGRMFAADQAVQAGSAKDLNDALRAPGVAAEADLISQTASGNLAPGEAVKRFFALKGSPLYSFHDYGVGNNLTGLLDTTQTAPLYTQGKQAEIDLRGAQTGAAKANAVQSYAAADNSRASAEKTREEKKQLGAPKAADFRDTTTLRKEFEDRTEVKNFRQSMPVLDAAKTAPDSPQGDLQLIYAVGKILDPNSVVREGEMSLVVKSGSPQERVEGFLNYLQGGGRLSPKARARLIKAVESRTAEYQRDYNQVRKTYEGLAQKNGMAPADVFMNDRPAPATPAARTVVRTGMLNGRKVVQYSDGTTDYAD